MLQEKSLIFGINKELCDLRDIPSLRLHNFKEMGVQAVWPKTSRNAF